MLAERQVVAGLVVLRIVAQRHLVTFYCLSKLLMVLHDDAHVVETLGAAYLVGGLQVGRLGKLLHGERVFLLHHERTAQVVDRLWIVGIAGYRLAILHLGSRPFACPVLAVALTDEGAVVLCQCCNCTDEEQPQQQAQPAQPQGRYDMIS